MKREWIDHTINGALFSICCALIIFMCLSL